MAEFEPASNPDFTLMVRSRVIDGRIIYYVDFYDDSEGAFAVGGNVSIKLKDGSSITIGVGEGSQITLDYATTLRDYINNNRVEDIAITDPRY